LKLAETLPSMPFERRLKVRPDDRHIIGAVGRQRTIAPVPAHPNGSHERAAAVLAAAGQQQRVGSGWGRFGERILRVRVRAG